MQGASRRGSEEHIFPTQKVVGVLKEQPEKVIEVGTITKLKIHLNRLWFGGIWAKCRQILDREVTLVSMDELVWRACSSVV